MYGSNICVKLWKLYFVNFKSSFLFFVYMLIIWNYVKNLGFAFLYFYNMMENSWIAELGICVK